MTEEQAKAPKLTIDGTEYSLNTLSDEVKAQVATLRYIDDQITDLQNKVLVFRAARVQYVQKLKESLPDAPVVNVSDGQ
jgi:hypothetical protein